MEHTPFTELSMASAPSTETSFERARCPPKFSPLVGAAPIEGVSSRTCLRVEQREVDVVAAVDWQVVDLGLRDGCGDVGLCGFHESAAAVTLMLSVEVFS